MHPASMESLLEAPTWSIFFGVLARMKTFFLANLDPFFKSLESFQRLKMDFWKRWRDGRKIEKKIIFFSFSLFPNPKKKILEFSFCANPKREDSSPLFHAMNSCPRLLPMKALFLVSYTHTTKNRSLFIRCVRREGEESNNIWTLLWDITSLHNSMQIHTPKKNGMPPFLFFYGRTRSYLISHKKYSQNVTHIRRKK